MNIFRERRAGRAILMVKQGYIPIIKSRPAGKPNTG
jgi:hypothetical protein